ncbi:S-methyl-5-thioribose-1-phosphate isomerase [Megalodesulfovibrio gigas]|uniref:Methylthioribose-1-phosphate isomerase n=1 Tax=Megalodesulfovibrio gigas (strain ATCC 19364 / DSM 1382 / NCIMB 9332 / VKM B-1759) TaxID=1121448 RepID=T2GBN0_MEGG1|nr:S-methyl-5-thioribose-1-phosphate isomerase [Megalodesulfovibrio gigas]AGW13554.1 putative translation initiation factor, aIF-2BI family [Megalodesulfovibrio gigas DSM 1382 = ATCC 19364]
MTEHIQYDATRQVLVLLDQRKLPCHEEWFDCRTTEELIYALQTMVVRGAPAIGVTAAYGCHLIALEVAKETGSSGNWRQTLRDRLHLLKNARPTAVNLAWAVDRSVAAWDAQADLELAPLAALWLEMAIALHAEDLACCKSIGRFGGALLQDGDTVMTHCNAGALATAGYGTALGVIRGAIDQGKAIKVIANETRPFLQGARLTAWELHRDGIPVTIACDNACGLLMRRGMVDAVVVGADRIAANGDAVNKIGTYGVAVLAKQHGIPFYVAAPLSTIDRATPTGDHVPIEDRTPREVTHVGDVQICPDGVPVFNYAFDPTPAELIAGIVTERGVLTAPYADSITRVFAEAARDAAGIVDEME